MGQLKSSLIFSFLVIHIHVTCVLSATAINKFFDNETSTENIVVTSGSILSKDDRVEIIHDSLNLKEIDHDILQVIGDLSNITLFCHSTRNNSAFVEWLYHGSQQYSEEYVRFERGNQKMFIDLSGGPSVVRLECVLNDNNTITNNTLIYTGDDTSPYLFKNQETVAATVMNETIAVLPCLLKYPMESTDDKELQLFKNGKLVENKDNCLNYTPELGYYLNLTKVDDPLGTYECRVQNSSDNDYIMVELTKASFIHVRYKGNKQYFHEKYPYLEPFDCSVPKSMFNEQFQWFYLLDNGSYIAFEPDRNASEWIPKEHSASVYTETVRLFFPSMNITHVVCASQAKEPLEFFNNTVPVTIRESFIPEIVNGPPNSKPIKYTKGKNLTCAAIGEPILFRWLKDGDPVYDLNTTEFHVSEVKTSTIFLNPSADDVENNYTCQVTNFLGNASHSFRVQLRDDEERWSGLIITVLVGVLAVLLLLLLTTLAFFKVKVTRRFDSAKIDRFLHGYKIISDTSNEFDSKSAAANEYESMPYDTSKNIERNSIIFGKELKGGNFGKVHFGFLKRGELKLPVAIKTIKDNPNASQHELEWAFENFLREIKLMQCLGEHSNVVGYVGAMTADIVKYSAYLVVEYCNKGDLATYLKERRGNFLDDIGDRHQIIQNNMTYSGLENNKRMPVVLKSSHLMKWAEEIATGMEYVSTKNILHMDLATRNVLLHYDGYIPEGYEPDPVLLTAKISDFGLSKALDEQPKDYYTIVVHPEPEKNPPRSLPLRWLSPEALTTLRFTPENDVWALGITFWEMFTLGEVPYKDLPLIDGNLRMALINFLESGELLHEPDYVPRDMWDVMLGCWNWNPADRPNFTEIKMILHAINENRVNEEQRQVQNPPNLPNGYSSVNIISSGQYHSVTQYNGGGNDIASDTEHEQRDENGEKNSAYSKLG